MREGRGGEGRERTFNPVEHTHTCTYTRPGDPKVVQNLRIGLTPEMSIEKLCY